MYVVIQNATKSVTVMQLQSKILSFRHYHTAAYSTQQLKVSIYTESEFIHSIIYSILLLNVFIKRRVLHEALHS